MREQREHDEAQGPEQRVSALAVAVCAFAVVLAGCVPSNRGEVSELDAPDEVDPAEVVAGDELDRDALVDALAADIGRRPDDLNFWVPSPSEASCTSERVVDGVGSDRLWGLGYRPGLAGASIGALEFTAAEEAAVVEAFVECVDMNEAVAQIFLGRGRMPPTVATCMADGLENVDQLEPFIEALALGKATDPFAGGDALATAMSATAAICIPEQAFDWPGLRLPGREEVFDVTAPGGTSGSRFEDDQNTTTETQP